jgi:hypothetical protein
MDMDGTVSFSPAVDVTVGNEHSYPSDLNISAAPNPLSGAALLRFTLPSGGPVTIAISDMLGRVRLRVLDSVFRTTGTHEVPIQADSFPPGMYLCSLRTAGSVALTRLLVIR